MISLPKVIKNFSGAEAVSYVFRPASQLVVTEEPKAKSKQASGKAGGEEPSESGAKDRGGSQGGGSVNDKGAGYEYDNGADNGTSAGKDKSAGKNKSTGTGRSAVSGKSEEKKNSEGTGKSDGKNREPGAGKKTGRAAETDTESPEAGFDGDLDDSSWEDAEEELSQGEEAIRFAQIQAEAILADAKAEAEKYRTEEKKKADQEIKSLKEKAQQEGFDAGYAEGFEKAAQECEQQLDQLSAQQINEVADFLKKAAKERDRILDQSREELKELAVAIAEKVIRVSLKNSSDILLRMVDAATDTHKKCAWAHIYVADCDLQGKVFTMPELTEALGHVSERIRVIPMADDESGTCIVELPDAILDASVSTQLGNIRELLKSTALD